jgi:hypothetical protein
MSNPERIKHIFQFINFDGLTGAQKNFVISLKEQFLDRGKLSYNQMKILEDIYRRAAVK